MKIAKREEQVTDFLTPKNEPVANARKLLQACIYKFVITGPFLKSLIATSQIHDAYARQLKYLVF